MDSNFFAEVIQNPIAEIEKRIILTFDRDYEELIFKYNLKTDECVIYLRLNKDLPSEPGLIVGKLLKSEGFKTNKALTVFNGHTIRQRKY